MCKFNQMDNLLKSLGYNNFEIINEVTGKIILNGLTYIIKLITDDNILPYLEIQNNGGSKYIPRMYELKHYYYEELNQEYSYGRKGYYRNHESLYLVQFEYINGFPFWDYYDKQIPLNYLSKLIEETWKSVV